MVCAAENITDIFGLLGQRRLPEIAEFCREGTNAHTIFTKGL